MLPVLRIKKNLYHASAVKVFLFNPPPLANKKVAHVLVTLESNNWELGDVLFSFFLTENIAMALSYSTQKTA